MRSVAPPRACRRTSQRRMATSDGLEADRARDCKVLFEEKRDWSAVERFYREAVRGRRSVWMVSEALEEVRGASLARRGDRRKTREARRRALTVWWTCSSRSTWTNAATNRRTRGSSRANPC
eukprot:scaffold282_cov345-Pavlova_lutheri.AAC.30